LRRNPVATVTQPCWQHARIAVALQDDAFLLDDGTAARQALSCLVTPEPGDSVLLLRCAQGRFVTQVLHRAGDTARVQLRVPGAQVLCLSQPALEVNAASHIALRCLGEMELTSAQGAVAISARHILASATETLVHNARHMVSHAQHCVLQVAALLRIHGKQALLTAEEDMKLDAERISLG
jgi:hypothetical protein